MLSRRHVQALKRRAVALREDLRWAENAACGRRVLRRLRRRIGIAVGLLRRAKGRRTRILCGGRRRDSRPGTVEGSTPGQTQMGAKIYASSSRVAGIQFPRVGWRRGIFLVGVYAPTSDSTTGERQDVRDKVTQLLQLAQATSITCVLGDLNAELGNNVDRSRDAKYWEVSHRRGLRWLAANGGSGQ